MSGRLLLYILVRASTRGNKNVFVLLYTLLLEDHLNEVVHFNSSCGNLVSSGAMFGTSGAVLLLYHSLYYRLVFTLTKKQRHLVGLRPPSLFEDFFL